MTGTRAAEFLREMPPKEHRLVHGEDRLTRLEANMRDQIVAIARVVMFAGSAGSLSATGGTLIATSQRLICLARKTDAMTVIPYSDVEQLQVVGGTKKLFGGYEDVYLMISKRQGAAPLRWGVGSDPHWANRSVRAILDAHQMCVLNGGAGAEPDDPSQS